MGRICLLHSLFTPELSDTSRSLAPLTIPALGFGPTCAPSQSDVFIAMVGQQGTISENVKQNSHSNDDDNDEHIQRLYRH